MLQLAVRVCSWSYRGLPQMPTLDSLHPHSAWSLLFRWPGKSEIWSPCCYQKCHSPLKLAGLYQEIPANWTPGGKRLSSSVLSGLTASSSIPGRVIHPRGLLFSLVAFVSRDWDDWEVLLSLSLVGLLEKQRWPVTWCHNPSFSPKPLKHLKDHTWWHIPFYHMPPIQH